MRPAGRLASRAWQAVGLRVGSQAVRSRRRWLGGFRGRDRPAPILLVGHLLSLLISYLSLYFVLIFLVRYHILLPLGGHSY
eukprot:12149956-Heterocapsa_arctica.AAC.1